MFTLNFMVNGSVVAARSGCNLLTMLLSMESLQRILQVFEMHDVFGQADHVEDFLKVRRQATCAYFLLDFLRTGQHADDDRHAGRVDIFDLTEIEYNMLGFGRGAFIIGIDEPLLGCMGQIAVHFKGSDSAVEFEMDLKVFQFVLRRYENVKRLIFLNKSNHFRRLQFHDQPRDMAVP